MWQELLDERSAGVGGPQKVTKERFGVAKPNTGGFQRTIGVDALVGCPESAELLRPERIPEVLLA